MKIGKLIAKIAVALVAVAGIVFVVATYGEQIVAWCKKLMDTCACKCNCKCQCDVVEEAAEEAAAEEVVVEEAVAEEVIAEEIPADEAVAEDADFEN